MVSESDFYISQNIPEPYGIIYCSFYNAVMIVIFLDRGSQSFASHVSQAICHNTAAPSK
jgi:hypothetical protein